MFNRLKFINMKDAIAVLLVSTFCISIFLPEYFVSQDTMEQFERILCTVIGFYFGTHMAEPKAETKAQPQKKTRK